MHEFNPERDATFVVLTGTLAGAAIAFIFFVLMNL